ncbi:hypothetical protein LSH36_150g03046 [Paralvinella palmiformis]|uniref:RING-type domain-containing protein n=1 Tax=Paralvinella palmiformis TaxID=53620 RepID=A0AAD9JW78_9ANNE|nr:hypothetical protein LSH36_150g03046 [Paralvinella palmiformis]
MDKPFLIGSLLGKEELICLLCSEYFRDPRILPCQDTFCRKCLQTIFDEKQAKTSVKIASILCPKCHAVTALPDIGVSGFPLDVNIRKKKDEFMEKLLDSARPLSGEQSTTPNKSHSLPKMAKRLFEERQKEEEASKPSFMKHDWNTHILGSFDNVNTSNDDLDQLRRNRPTFSPGTRRHQLVDGLIRSRRERSPHVSTRNAPSATPRFTPIDPNLVEDSHTYRPFSGSRPARLASPRSKLNTGLHHKSDPGFDRTTFKSPTSPDGFLSPDFVPSPVPSTETNNNIPDSSKDAVSDIPEDFASSGRQSRSRRQVHFKDSQPGVIRKERETTKTSDPSEKFGKSPVIRDSKSDKTSTKRNTGSTHSDGTSITSDNTSTSYRPDMRQTGKISSVNKTVTDGNKVPSSFLKSSSSSSTISSSASPISSSSSKLSSSEWKAESHVGSRSPITPTSPLSHVTKTSPSMSHAEQINTDKPSVSSLHGKTSPQRRYTGSQQVPPSLRTSSSPIIASSSNTTPSKNIPSSPIGASSPRTAPSPIATSSPSHDPKLESVEFSESGRTSPGKVRRRPGIPSSLRSPTDKSRSPDGRRPYLSPTRGKVSPTLKTSPRGANTLPRNHKPNVFTFDSGHRAKNGCSEVVGEAPPSARTSTTPTCSGDNRKMYDNSSNVSRSSGHRTPLTDTPVSDDTTAHVKRDKEMGRVVGQAAEPVRRGLFEGQPSSVSTTRLHNSYQSSRGSSDKPTGFSGPNIKDPSANVVTVTGEGQRRSRVAEKTVNNEEASQRPGSKGKVYTTSVICDDDDTPSVESGRRARYRQDSTVTNTSINTSINATISTSKNQTGIITDNDDGSSRAKPPDGAAINTNRPGARLDNTPGSATTTRWTTPGVDQIKGRIDKDTSRDVDASNESVSDNTGLAGGSSGICPDRLRTTTTKARLTANIDVGSFIPTTVAEQNRINNLEEERDINERLRESYISDEDKRKKDAPKRDKYRSKVENWKCDSVTESNRTAKSATRDIPIFRKEPMNVESPSPVTSHGTGGYSCATANGLGGVSVSDKLGAINREGEVTGKIGDLITNSEDDSTELSGEDSGTQQESSWSAIYQDIYDDITREVSKEREKLGESKIDVSKENGTSADTLNNSYDTDQSSLRDDTTQTPGGRISSKERKLGGATRLVEPEVEVTLEEEEDMTPEKPVYSTTELWCVEKREYEMPTSLVILSNGTTVVAEFNSGRLQYYDDTGTFVHNVDGVKPFCITASGEDHVIVADRRHKTVRGFDQYGVDTIQWEDNQFKWISGIGCLSDGHLVIYNRDNYKVGIYNKSGDKLSEFGSYGERDTQLCMADFLAVDSNDRILLCDSGNHCIKIFDVGGRFLLKFGVRGHKNGQMEWPKGVCCDNNDNIIVADNRNARVSLYSPDGEFIQHLVKNVANPYGVCLSRDNTLLGVTHYALTGYSQLAMYKLTDFVPSDTSDEPETRTDVTAIGQSATDTAE